MLMMLKDRCARAGRVSLTLALAGSVLGVAPALADDSGELSRRSWIGAKLAGTSAMGSGKDAGVAIMQIAANGSAHVAGLKPGDVVTSVDGTPVATPDQFRDFIRTAKGGSTSKLSVLRRGQEREVAITWQTIGSDTMQGASLTYGAVTVPAGYRLRTIVTRPMSTNVPPEGRPAVLFIQNASCATIDMPTMPDAPERRLMEDLSNAGWITMRVDKAGVGDSEGPPCDQTDFDTETAGFVAAAQQLATLEGVDTNRVYVFGLGTGGAIAPLVAQQVKVRGVATYGAPSRTWLEHELASTRAQMDLYDIPGPAAAKELNRQGAFLSLVLGAKQSPADVFAQKPELKPTGGDRDPLKLDGRDPVFFQQLQDFNIASAWNKVTSSRVLTIWGEYDSKTSQSDARRIAKFVNEKVKNAESIVLAQHDHGMTWFENRSNSALGIGKGAWTGEVSKAFLTWASSVDAAGTAPAPAPESDQPAPTKTPTPAPSADDEKPNARAKDGDKGEWAANPEP